MSPVHEIDLGVIKAAVLERLREGGYEVELELVSLEDFIERETVQWDKISDPYTIEMPCVRLHYTFHVPKLDKTWVESFPDAVNTARNEVFIDHLSRNIAWEIDMEVGR